MTFTEDEKKMLKYLVEKELKDFKEDKIDRTNPVFLLVEKEYEMLLKSLSEKLQ